MKHYVRNLFTFLMLLACLLMAGCNDEKPELPEPEPAPGEITLTEFELPLNLGLDKIQAHSLILRIMDKETDRIFELETSFARFSSFLRFRLEAGLPDGQFMLLNALCQPNNGDEAYEVGMGMSIAITKGGFAVTSTYSPDLGFAGSGTEKDPYVISSIDHLLTLRKWMTKDIAPNFAEKFFRQQVDIDVAAECIMSWEPIAPHTNKPFSGVYDGGGKKITGLKINYPDKTVAVPGRGLFGVVKGGVIRNLTIANPKVTAVGYSAALVGLVLSEGSKRIQTQIQNCHVNGGTINGSVAMGALVGMVDQSTVLQLINCSNNAPVSGSVGAGGLVGMGVFSSTIRMDSCTNKGDVTGIMDDYISGIGGLVGVADTLLVIRSANYGTIDASIAGMTDDNVRGIGGIAGASGESQYGLCTNDGKVSGGRGVGGILGSTVVSMETAKEDAIYNPVIISGCINTKEISAVKMAGGILGEAQAVVTTCYNTAPVTASDIHAGGVVGFTPSALIDNSLNSGKITGKGYVGGIVAASYICRLIGDYNFGEVNTTAGGAVIGGIIGHAGNNTMVHYCGNYGRIKHTGGSGSAGGVTGMLGNNSEFTSLDVTNIVLSTVGIALSPLGVAGSARDFCLISQMAITGSTKFSTIVLAATSLTTVMITATYIYSVAETYYPQLNPYNISREQMESAYLALLQEVASKKQSVFTAGLTGQPSEYASLNTQVSNSQNVFCQKLTENKYSQQIAGNINQYSGDRSQFIAKEKADHQKAMTIANGVLLGISIVLLSLCGVGGVAGLVIAGISAAVGIAGGSTSIAQTLQDFELNTSVIEQSFNQGTLDITNADVYGGGMAGRMNDYGIIRNCFNTGSLQKNGADKSAKDTRQGGIIGYLGDKITVDATVNYALWSSHPAYATTKGGAVISAEDQCEVYYAAEKTDKSTSAYTKADLKKPATFTAADFLKIAYWTLDTEGYPVHTSTSYFD